MRLCMRDQRLSSVKMMQSTDRIFRARHPVACPWAWMPEYLARTSDDIKGEATWSGIGLDERVWHGRELCADMERGLTDHAWIIERYPVAWSEMRREGRTMTCAHDAWDVDLLLADRPMRWAWKGSASSWHLRVSPAFLAEVAEQVAGIDPSTVELRTVFRGRDDTLVRFAGMLHTEMTGRGVSSPLYVQTLAQGLAVHVLQRYGCRNARRVAAAARVGRLDSKRLMSALDYMRANLAETVYLDDLAEAVNMSPYHFCRTFRRTTGLAPHQYLIQLRVTKARDMLLRSDTPPKLAGVAQDCGFTDQAHFTRHFKRVVGLTPGQVIRQGRAAHA